MSCGEKHKVFRGKVCLLIVSSCVMRQWRKKGVSSHRGAGPKQVAHPCTRPDLNAPQSDPFDVLECEAIVGIYLVPEDVHLTSAYALLLAGPAHPDMLSVTAGGGLFKRAVEFPSDINSVVCHAPVHRIEAHDSLHGRQPIGLRIALARKGVPVYAQQTDRRFEIILYECPKPVLANSP
jgi:hypothetical protein